MAVRGSDLDRRNFYNHLCIFHVDTLHGMEQDKLEEFSEITWIGWTVVDFKRKKDIVLSEEVEITLSKIKGDNGIVYNCVTPETFNTATEMVVQSIKDLGSNVNCALICEGHLPLRHYLHRKARQKGVDLDPMFFTYFDLYTEFRKTFARTPGDTLEEMAESLGITLPGVKAEPMDDHKTSEGDEEHLVTSTTNGREEVTLKGIERQGIFAAVVMYLARMGHIFIDPLTIQHRWDFDPRVIPVPKMLRNSMVVGIQGIDYNLQYSDILDFFSGLNVVQGGLVVCINKNGQKNGRATILFEDVEQVELALLRDKHHLQNHGRYLILKKATVNEFLQQIYGTCRPLTSSPQIRRVVCRFKFLPEDTTREDILRWIRPLKVAGDTKGVLILVGKRSDKKPINESLVVFRTFDDMYEVLGRKKAEFKGQSILGQPVLITELIMLLRKTLRNQDIYAFSNEIFQTSMERVLLRFNLDDNKVLLKIHGLPSHYTGKDILRQFEHLGEEIDKGGVRTVLDGKGRFTGECQVTMKNAMSAFLAYHKLRNSDKHIKVDRTVK